MLPFSADERDLFYDVRNQLHADLFRRASVLQEKRREERRSIQTEQEWAQYRDGWKANLLRAIGGLPQEKTPLNARQTGAIETGNFRIEKILFESLPNFFVTGLCYVPHGLTKPAPTVLLVQGHVGKPWPAYQQLCGDLAAAGFIVFMIDPVGQAERSQYYSHGRHNLMSINTEHCQAGNVLFLHGQSLARYWAWDGIRALDYLCSRDDVDADRLAVTGHSGGGWQTFLLMALDSRLAAAAPCAITTTLHWIMKSAEPVDSEHIIHRALEKGPDYLDFLSAMAPRPVIGLATSFDCYFPVEGTLEAAQWARQVYELHGRGDAFEMVIDDDVHEYTRPLREACVTFFRKHLCGDATPFRETETPTFTAREMLVTQSGQVSVDEPHAISVADLCAREERVTFPRRSAEELRQELDDVLGVSRAGDRSAPIHPRLGVDGQLDGYMLDKLLFFSAEDVMVSGVICHPREAQPGVPLPAVVFLHEGGTSSAPTQRPLIESLLDSGKCVVIFDPRGVGAVRSRRRVPLFYEKSYWPFHNDCYNNACDAIQLGLNILGLRVFDVLRCLDYLSTRPDVASLEIYGVGPVALLGFFAAALDERVETTTCEKMLSSYRSITQTPYYDNHLYPLDLLPWGLLAHFDLPDLMPCFAGRTVRVLNPVDAKGRPVNEQWT